MPNQIQLKDAEQDSRITYLESKFESYREKMLAIQQQLENSPKGSDLDIVYERIDKIESSIKELSEKIRQNEIWIQRAAAVIGAAVTVIGIIVAIASVVDAQEVKNGSNDATKQEILLQFQSNRN